MVEAIGKPAGRGAGGRASAALRQVERAVGETLEHHAHVQLALPLGPIPQGFADFFETGAAVAPSSRIRRPPLRIGP